MLQDITFRAIACRPTLRPFSPTEHCFSKSTFVRTLRVSKIAQQEMISEASCVSVAVQTVFYAAAQVQIYPTIGPTNVSYSFDSCLSSKVRYKHTLLSSKMLSKKLQLTGMWVRTRFCRLQRHWNLNSQLHHNRAEIGKVSHCSPVSNLLRKSLNDHSMRISHWTFILWLGCRYCLSRTITVMQWA